MSAKNEKLARQIQAVISRLGFSTERAMRIQNSILSRSAAQPVVNLLTPGSLRQNAGVKLDPISFLPAFSTRLASWTKEDLKRLHSAGEVYLLDASSMFDLGGVHTIQDHLSFRPSIVDICSAPGGKAIALSRWLDPKWMLCNEVSRKRIKPLIANLERCRTPNALVSNLDPRQLSQEVPCVADIVLVDAPCSGQSVYAKGESAPGAFSKYTIETCAMRQRAILSSAEKIVRHGGWLIYSTCTYSREENERVVEWFVKNFSNFNCVEIESLNSYRSSCFSDETNWGYRLFPDEELGAGGFTCLLRKSIDHDAPNPPGNSASPKDLGLPTIWSSRTQT